MKGQIIVIEGCDGVGKNTQSKLLQKKLEDNGIQSIVRSFPSYSQPQAGPVEEYLRGKLGGITDLSSQQISVLYLVDMFISYKLEKWDELLEDGTWIIMDRYAESNMIYQASKCKSIDEAMGIIRYITYAGYSLFSLPKPSAVIYLDVSQNISSKLRHARGNNTDIHENDEEYMKKVQYFGLKIADMLDWEIIHCDNNDHTFIKEANEILLDIWDRLTTKLNYL